MNTYALRDNDTILNSDGKNYVLRIKDLPSEEKPREKLIKYGPTILSQVELLSIVLNTGTKKEGVAEMTSRIFKEYGENIITKETNPKEIEKKLNIPEVKACQIVACFELGRRFFKDRGGRQATVRTAKQVFEYLKDMRTLTKEHLHGIYLNSRNRIIHDEVISIGSLTANIVHPREVFRPALEYQAVAVIIAHNHPSGIIKPTKEDIEITNQLIKAGKILGINLLDHIIVTKNNFTSIPANY